MSGQKRNNAPKAFPHEWEFKRGVENAECILEARATGSEPVLKNPDVLCPFSIPHLVDDLIRRYCPKNEILDLFGTLYTRMRNNWYDHYMGVEELSGEQKLPSAPPAAAPARTQPETANV